MPPSSSIAGSVRGARQRRPRLLDPVLARLAGELFDATRLGAVSVRAAGIEAQVSVRDGRIDTGTASSPQHELLTVGARVELAAWARTFVAEPAQALELGRKFDGGLWLLNGALAAGSSFARSGLGVLRALLRPSAPVLLIAPARPPALAQLRALLSRERGELRPTLAALCEAVLLAGLCAPRVHAELPGWLAVSARVPRERTALDVFFEQPAVSTRR